MQKAGLQESHESISLFLVGQGYDKINVDLTYPEFADWRATNVGFFRSLIDG